MTDRTLDGLVALYLKERVKRGELTPRTARSHDSALRSFSRCFGRRPIDRLGPTDVERWLEEAVAAGHKPSTRGLRISILRGFFGWLRRRKLIRNDPLDGVKAPRRPRQVVHVFSPGDTTKVLNACPDTRARAIVTSMNILGLRCVEVSRLDVEDWDRSASTLRVVGKALHERHVPVIPQVQAELDAYMTEHPASSGPLFRSYTSRASRLTPKYVSELVAGWHYDAGVKHRPYDGLSAHAHRRTAATELLMATMDMTATQELLGHANVSTLNVYLKRASTERVRAALTQRVEGGTAPDQ